MTIDADRPALVSPKEVARVLGRSTRWVYAHWRELGGTRAFGPVSFFPDIISERLETARQEAEAMVLQMQRNRGAHPGGRPCQPPAKRRISTLIAEDPHGVFSTH
jgi:hypothetical protein